jgi:hypothetical protein
MVSMVVISCISYAANKLATRYVFEDHEVVSVVGAFVTGILGNLYALKFSGSAFTMHGDGCFVSRAFRIAGGEFKRGDDGWESHRVGKLHCHRWDRDHGRIVRE